MLRGIGVAWGGVRYYYRAERGAFALLLVGLGLVSVAALRAGSGPGVAALVLALAFSQSAAMFRYAMGAVLRLGREQGLGSEYRLGMWMVGTAEALAVGVMVVVVGLMVMG